MGLKIVLDILIINFYNNVSHIKNKKVSLQNPFRLTKKQDIIPLKLFTSVRDEIKSPV